MITFDPATIYFPAAGVIKESKLKIWDKDEIS